MNNSEIIFCPKCGTKQEGNAYCSKCGVKLIDNEYNNNSRNQIHKPIGFFGINKNKITRHSAFRWYMRKYRISTIVVVTMFNIGILPIAVIISFAEKNFLIGLIIFVTIFYIWNDIIGKLICKSSMKKIKKKNPDYNFD